MSQASFSQLPLDKALLENLTSLNYLTMTPVQAQSLPLSLAGKDVIVQAKTGSGKTASFCLAVLNNLQVSRFRVQALILCPTRELADQVAIQMRNLARAIHNIKVLTLCGGVSIGPQIGSLEHGAHIIVGTPGRVADHLRKGTLNLDEVNTLVLDEADQMLDMGFQDTLDEIVELLPPTRQNLLFSATYPARIEQVAKRVMTAPEMIKVEEITEPNTIKQQFFLLENSKLRLNSLKLLLLQHKPMSCVVFCNTKAQVQQVADELQAHGFSANALHGDLEQKDRDRTLIQFANRSTAILVATDVAARGLDIDDVDMVVNYHLAHDTATHIHRIGRTGRAGKKGLAASLYTQGEAFKVAEIGDHFARDFPESTLPSFSLLEQRGYPSEMVTLVIDGGKKQKLRPTDILGALTSEQGVAGKQVGKIKVQAVRSFVAIERDAAKVGLRKLSQGKMKGRQFRVKRLT